MKRTGTPTFVLTGIAVAATPDDERKFELEGVG